MTNIEHPHKDENCEICDLMDHAIRPVIEQEMRQKIAKEIEAQIESLSLGDGLFKSGMLGAAAIARGTK
jgi:hypothetical protein